LQKIEGCFFEVFFVFKNLRTRFETSLVKKQGLRMMKISVAFKIKSLWAVLANYINFKHLFLGYLLISKKLMFEIGSHCDYRF
jgi:hypothetical protein